MRRIDSLEAVRGVAAVAVLLAHSRLGGRGDGVLLLGWLGVPVFFVLSGLVLYLPYAQGKQPDTLAFWRRRAARILPGYWTALAVVAAIVMITGGAVHNLSGQAMLFGEFWHGPHDGQLIQPAWTLAAELVFYSVLPLFILVFAAMPRLRLPLLFAVINVSLAYKDDHRATTPLAFFAMFAFGMAAAVLVARGTRSWWLAAAGLAVFVAALVFLDSRPERFPFGEAAALAFALALVPLATRDIRVPRPLVALGTISFGVYLWHWPIFAALAALGWTTWSWTLNTAVALALTIAAATISYQLVEKPAIAWARTPRRERPVVFAEPEHQNL